MAMLEQKGGHTMRRRLPRRAKSVRYLVLWWQNQTPYAAMFNDEVSAYAAASVRNALLIEVPADGKIERIVDYFRRDDKGNPLPAEWRDVVPPLGLPWMARPNPVS